MSIRLSSRVVLAIAFSCLSGLTSVSDAAATPAAGPHVAGRAEAVVANDNRHAAGWSDGLTWHIDLRAANGEWWPEDPRATPRRIQAFGERWDDADGPLSVPAPLIRVRTGTIVHARVRNDLGTPLLVHGLCAHNDDPCPELSVPPGESRQVEFPAGSPGTYHYWATSHGSPLGFRALGDSQMSGAFIVDDVRTEALADAVARVRDSGAEDDRIFVITEWIDISEEQVARLLAAPDPGAVFVALRPDVLFAINGRAWPFTERVAAEVNHPVHWRVINLSTQFHPMHLHGFYFDVDSQGDGGRDRPFAADHRPHVVTHLLPPGGTMAMTWVPERAGQWLFHCHTMLHVSPSLHVDGSPRTDVDPHASHGTGGNLGMTGLVLGVVVRDTAASGAPVAAAPATAPSALPPPRRLTLDMRREEGRFGSAPALGFVLTDDDGNGLHAAGHGGRVTVPGPTLVLRRGEPVEITLNNQLGEPTSIHWHGIELESFYDGVHGWSGAGSQLAPAIAPGQRFVVRFTPPRSGTFIYHTHLHDNRQLTSGLYGALLVVDRPGLAVPGRRDSGEPAAGAAGVDATTDHVMVIGRGGPALDAPVVLNGQVAPQLVWRAGTRHRLRLVNITPNDIVRIRLVGGASPLSWTPVAKDGASIADLSAVAAAEVISAGETYDFEVEAPPGRGSWWLECTGVGGKWLAQAQVIIMPN